VLSDQQRIEIAIHRSGPEPRYSVDQLDFGPLLASLTEHPYYLAGMVEGGSLHLEITRTHEWELLVDLVVAGSSIFAEAVIRKVAERMVDWTVEQARRVTTRAFPQLRSPEGERAIVDAANPAASVEGIERLLREAAERNLRVTLIIEPTEQ
jgi:hypothetical protein